MYRTISVDVEVDLSDFETDDLMEELESRGHPAAATETDPVSTLNELHYALKFGLADKALDAARRYVNDVLGTCL